MNLTFIYFFLGRVNVFRMNKELRNIYFQLNYLLEEGGKVPKGSLIDEKNQIKNITKSFATQSLNQSRTATSNLGYSEFSNTHTNDDSRADSNQSKDDDLNDYNMIEAKAIERKAKTEGLDVMLNVPSYLLDKNTIKILKTEDYTEAGLKFSSVKPLKAEKNFMLKVKIDDFVMRQSYVIRVLRIISKTKVDESNPAKPAASDHSLHTEEDFHFSIPNSKRVAESNNPPSSDRIDDKHSAAIRNIVRTIQNNMIFFFFG
jgi:hypothetical protein